MDHQPPSTPVPSSSRRTMMKGAAWATPVAVTAIAAPAYAVSQPPGLNGWVGVSADCTSGRNSATESITIDGTGTYPDRGLWATPAKSTQKPTDAKITFYFPDWMGDLTWRQGSGNSGWSAPTRVNSGKRGYYAYQTTYSGDWTYVPSRELWTANGKPFFTTSFRLSRCTRFRVYALRSVNIGGKVLDFERDTTVGSDWWPSRAEANSARAGVPESTETVASPAASDGGGGEPAEQPAGQAEHTVSETASAVL